MLFLNGVYIVAAKGARSRFHRVNELSSREQSQLTHKIARQVGRYRDGKDRERDAENSYLALDTADTI